MRLIFWVTALAVVTAVCAKNSTAKSKPKRQLESIRSAQDFQYSLVLPHSRVQQFRSLTSGRRISYGTPKSGKLPPYAVQMEPVVQYSQKDPLYDPSLDNVEDTGVNKNEITAQPKILNVDDQVLEGSYGPPYGSLPTAPLYSQDTHPHYYEAPEPIIEIIIKESNESLPAPPPQPILNKKKEPVQVFYVKYTKDPHHHDKVIYEKPIPAITPPSNHEDDHHEEYVTVTPEPLYLPPKTTTLRAIIKPESEVYHSDSSVKVTFGSESHYHGDNLEHSEGHEETAPRPAIAFPQPPPSHPPLERSASSSSQQYHDIRSNGNSQSYRPSSQQAQSRIQFQQPYLSGEPQLPKQGPTLIPFRAQPQPPRQNSFSPTPSNAHPGFANGPVHPTPHFSNIAPTVPGPIGPTFSTGFPRGNNGPPFFQQRPSGHQFASRPHSNNPPRPTFHPGPQRPFNKPQQQSFFDEAKYLAENYHTITTDQVDPPKEQGLPINRQPQIFNSNIPKPGPSPTPAFQEHRHPPQLNFNQQLPHQRPIQPFDHVHSNPLAVTPSRSPFFNLKPSPPHIEGNHVQFQQSQQHQLTQPIQQGFHNGPQTVSRPAPQPAPTPLSHNQFLPQPSLASQYSFRPQQSPFPENSFQQNQPSERPQFLNRQPSERPLLQQFHSPSERPQIVQSHSPSERPHFSQPQVNNHLNFHDQSNLQHQQNVGSFVPNNGELIASVPKYEQHITVSGPTAQPSYTGFTETNQLSPTASNINVQYHQQQQHQRQQQQHEQQQQEQRQQQQQHEKQQQQLQEQQQQQQIQDQRQQQQLHEQRQQQQQLQEQRQSQQQQHQLQLQQQQQYQQHNQQQQQYRETQQQQQQQQQFQNLQQQQTQYQESQQQQQNLYDTEQEQLKIQLAENVKKQQEEIQRLQAQLQYSEQQQQQQQQQHQQNLQQSSEYEQQLRNAVQRVTTSRPQQHQERSRQPSYATSTVSPIYFQSTSRTVEIKPTTQKYVSSTINSISSGSEAKKEQNKKRPAIELPDEVPDDLRQQLLSSGILDNADISVLDYDKVGETPLESLPPDQLANFFSAGGGQQISSSELRPIVVKPNGDQIESRIDDESEDDQDIAASENVPMYVTPPQSNKQAVEMKVVHFDPNTAEGQNIAKEYVKENATQVNPVALNDKKYNRYLPLKVSGNQFPLPDVLKGRKVTSVVVLAPVETEDINNNHVRAERAAGESLKGIKFVAGDSLQDLLKTPSRENFQRWLDIEKKTATDLQSVVLLVTGNDEASNDREIYMYDISSGNVNKLSGDLSNAFVEAADNNSLTKDIEQLAIEGDGIPEDFNNGNIADGSENVPFLVDLSGVSVMENSNQVSIASGYSKTKHGRSLRRP